jgi:hypothetical protein
MPRPARYWNGTPPEHCDTCKGALEGVFFDARTRGGYWAHMCLDCFDHGPGLGVLGLGNGQKYEQLSDGRWLKTGG